MDKLDWIEILNSVPDVCQKPKEVAPPDSRPFNQRAIDRAWRVRGKPDGIDRPRAGYWRKKGR